VGPSNRTSGARLGHRLPEEPLPQLGPDRDHTEGGYEKIVTAPEHAAMCAAPTIP